MSPARSRTRTARSWDERTNHEATAPPSWTTVGGMNMNWVIRSWRWFQRTLPRDWSFLYDIIGCWATWTWNLGSAQIPEEEAIWDLRAQSTHYRVVCAEPKTNKHHTDPRRPGDNSNRGFRNRKSKKKYIQNEIASEKPDYTSSAKLREKLKIMLGFLNYAKYFVSTIDKSLFPSPSPLNACHAS